MPDFPYTPNPAKIPRFLDHIQDSGVPSKVTKRYLESVGFKSKNDRSLIPVFKAIGFVDGNGVTTDTWTAFKDKGRAKAVLAGALKSSYSDLFKTYPDAHTKDQQALYNYFATRTGHAKATVEKVVRSFQVLCGHADFEGVGETGTAPVDVAPQPPTGATTAAPAAPPTPSVTISIQLQLPATDDASVYDNFFAAMKKHLFS